MLNIVTSMSSDAAKSYFAKSDYYSEGQELVGSWHGKAASMLGLNGKIEWQDFEKMCDNIDPRTDKPLTAKTLSNRRSGFDFCWSAPKSVSLVHTFLDDERIVEAFQNAIHETMREIEADVQTRVRKAGQDSDRLTGNFAYAEFVHLTSRPVNKIPDPQLHIHCFAFNSTYDPIEKQWKAIQLGQVKHDAYYWQAVQQARFATNLEALGYRTEKTKDAFEIVGVSRSIIEKFSRRSEVIKEAIEELRGEYDVDDPAFQATLAATTREKKNSEIPYPGLQKTWQNWLTPEEKNALTKQNLLHEPQIIELNDREAVRFAIDHTFERTSVADEKRLLATALRHGIGNVTPEGIRKELNSADILRKKEGNITSVTTKAVLKEEHGMISFAANGQGKCKPVCQKDEIRFREKKLNSEQRQAIEHVLTSSDKVMLIRGAAGTGKTTLTREAVSQINERGKNVAMIAHSAEASRGVLRSEGFEQADTLAKFLADPEIQATAQNGFIWLDEASLVGTKKLLELFRIADTLQARVVLSGDEYQHGSIERGAALRVLQTIGKLPCVEVTKIQRQESAPYKEAVKKLSQGEIAAGFEILDKQGAIHLLPVWDKYNAVAEEYIAKRDQVKSPDRDVAIISPTHSEAALVTTAVRSELRKLGKLGEKDHEYSRLVPLQWTTAERGNWSQYNGEEIIQFHRNSGPFKAGQRLTFAEAGEVIKNVKPENFSVYALGTINLADGDLIRITTNGNSMDGHRLNNGAIYTVKKILPTGDLKLSNGWVIGQDFGHLASGFVSTSHAAQGRTVEHAIVVDTEESYPASSQAGFYVAASRARKSLTVFTDDKRTLLEAVSRNDRQKSALEIFSGPKPSYLQRAQQSIRSLQQRAMIAAKELINQVHDVLFQREPQYER